MKKSNNKKTRDVTAFIYPRLSRDDNLEGESYSISNQKKLLTKMAKDMGYTNIVTFVDDGVSGVTMDRPGFNEMMRQLEEGKASALFVKDLSRLGRNYIEVGRLMEEFFPEHDIRLVAVQTTSTPPRVKMSWPLSVTCSMSGTPGTSAKSAVSAIRSRAMPGNQWGSRLTGTLRTRIIRSTGL